MYADRLHDIGTRGQLGFNKGILKTHAEAEQYARRTYRTAIEQDCFVAGWNKAFWDEAAYQEYCESQRGPALNAMEQAGDHGPVPYSAEAYEEMVRQDAEGRS